MKLSAFYESTSLSVRDLITHPRWVPRWESSLNPFVKSIEDFIVIDGPIRQLQLNEIGITSLEGCPEMFDGILCCARNKLVSFKGAPKILKAINAIGNPIKTLHNVHEDLHEVSGYISLDDDNVNSHVLGLLLIKKLQLVSNGELDSWTRRQGRSGRNDTNSSWATIVNRHLPSKGRSSMYDCQAELIEAGLDEYAQL